MEKTLMISVLLVSVFGAPGLKLGLGSVSVPVGPSNDADSLNVGLSGGGLEISKHSERVTESEEHNEELRNDTSDNSKDGDHVNKTSSSITRIHDSHHTHKQSQDTGLKLGGGGLNMFDNQRQIDDKVVTDRESGQNSTLNKDRDANSAHMEASGSDYNKTTQTHDHEGKYQNNEFSLLGGKNGASRQSGSFETRQKTTHEEGSSWKKTKDISRDGHKIEKSSTNQSSRYGKDSTEVSSKSSQEKENRNTQEK